MVRHIFISLRPKQWIKNFFVLLPLVFGAKLFTFPANFHALIGFCLFSLTASATYLINDILDIDQDRAHPAKRSRPIASGKITIARAKLLAVVLMVAPIILAFKLNEYFSLILVVYTVFGILYSKVFKRVVIIDVFCLAAFFYLRIIAGSMIAGVVLSHWIVLMTVLLSFFLGFNKRRQELKLLDKNPCCSRAVLTDYNPYFIDQMISVITSSIVVVYMLYTIDSRTVTEFGTTHLLYTIPFVYYGVFRYLYLIHKLHHEGNPTEVLFSDPMMIINLLVWGVVSVSVIYFGL